MLRDARTAGSEIKSPAVPHPSGTTERDGALTIRYSIGRRQFYVRQLRDAKIKPVVEAANSDMASVHAKMCDRVLARAHAKTRDPATINGYLGNSDQFDEAMADFAVVYVDRAERDYAALKAAVKSGKITACQGSV